MYFVYRTAHTYYDYFGHECTEYYYSITDVEDYTAFCVGTFYTYEEASNFVDQNT